VVVQQAQKTPLDQTSKVAQQQQEGVLLLPQVAAAASDPDA
jgi:hypothetical protein